MSMLSVTVTARLEPPRPLTAEEIGDVIEAMTDTLHSRVIDPSVSTADGESVVEVEVEATVDQSPGDPWPALQEALSAVREAFTAAVPDGVRLSPRLEMRSAPVADSG